MRVIGRVQIPCAIIINSCNSLFLRTRVRFLRFSLLLPGANTLISDTRCIIISGKAFKPEKFLAFHLFHIPFSHRHRGIHFSGTGKRSRYRS